MGSVNANSVLISNDGPRRVILSPRMLLAVACLLFCFQQLPYFQSRWIEDESSYSDAAWTFAHDGRIHMSMFPPTDVASVADVRPPAMAIALGGMFRIVGLGVWQARLLPLLGALAAILVTYLLGAYLAGEWVGAVGALLVATDSLLFVAGRTTRPEGVEAFLNTLAALLFMVAMRRDSWMAALAAGLVAGLSINFHINGAIAPIAMALWAIYEYGLKVWRKPVAWTFAFTAALCIVPYVLWINMDALHHRAYVEMRTLGTEIPFSKFHGEIMRYSDFIGIGSSKLPLPIQVPVRAPVAMLIVASLGVLYVRNRRLFWYLGLFLAAHMGWWYYLANKNVRYTAVAAPLFALIVAAGCMSLASTPKHRKIVAALCLLYGAIGIAGNAYLVNRFKNADYVAVTAQLRQAVPEGATVYGANTFWLALHDRRYYSYDRSGFDYAIANLKPQYLILYDRVMMHGSGLGADDFGAVRTKAAAFVQAHGEKVTDISNQFYGDLAIYRVIDAADVSSQPK
jgi:4-amino-4-deoxy-L-arabinose transferase-like glycosyltransferase